VADQATLGAHGIGIELAGQQARGAGADQHVGARGGADLRVQLALEFQALGRTLLDEVGVGHALLDALDETQPLQRGAGRQPLLLQRGPSVGQARAQRLLGAWGRVPGDHVEAVGQGAGDPAGTDHTGAEGGESLDLGNEGHA